ncbi:Fbox domain containing protein [Acanthamoeba castellanii str. Neff]|uniref:Fbox domain containing protein n=1 Tax=Acanthamoeba castellanii (strain ATCC 30010 / Neff) TaxID=1257118 RepID=L8GZR9_ACACF|nr:Fbox domain containing protein [Acanthamoeba castellanii str. Neff]ELR18472.1 Fbox domain containing protein [Acanthamoeba castellanii str. Neff]
MFAAQEKELPPPLGAGPHGRSQIVDFSLLPNEVAEHILCWLDAADLGAALLVCRQWAALITALPAWAEAKAAHDRKQRWGLRVPSRRLATQVEEYRIAVTGPGGVGRCAFTERFITGIMPTQLNGPEHSYRKQLTVDGVTAVVDINVSAGQEEYLALVQQILKTRELDLVANGSTWDTRVVTPDEGKRLADKWTAYSWGLGADSQAAEYHFRRNFFECSIEEAYLWEVHDIGVVVDEMVRQIDMWRRAVSEGGAVHAQGKKERKKKRGDKDKKCLLM